MSHVQETHYRRYAQGRAPCNRYRDMKKSEEIPRLSYAVFLYNLTTIVVSASFTDPVRHTEFAALGALCQPGGFQFPMRGTPLILSLL